MTRPDPLDRDAYFDYEAGYQDRLTGLPPSEAYSGSAYFHGYCNRIQDEIAADAMAAANALAADVNQTIARLCA